MDTRQLRQFLHLAGALHFGRASEAAHVSPSALSRSIRALEQELGTTLFDRDSRTVSLTRQGETFLAWARETLGGLDVLRDTLQAQAGELQGEVSLYCSVTASYSFLFELLTRVRRDHPQIEIKLHTGDPEDAIARVLAGQEDIAIGARPEAIPAGLAFRPIARSPLVFIAPVDLEIAGLEARRPGRATWGSTPMILPERGQSRRRVDRWFRALGTRPSIYAQAAGNEAIVSMVSLGLGVGVVPEIVLANSPLRERVKVLRVRPVLAPYEVGLFTLEKKLRSPLISAFWAPALHGRSSP
jgi:LysR family positive regulator for ilvC